MISRIGSPGHTESSSRVQKTGAQPAEDRSRNTNTREPATEAAAVVRISSEARARASSAKGAEQTRGAAPSDTRAEIDIEPVVAQPVPDFKGPKPPAAESTKGAPAAESTKGAPAAESTKGAPADEYQAPTKDSRVVA